MHAERPCELCLVYPISMTRVHPYGVSLCEGCTRGLMPDFMDRRGIQIRAELEVNDGDDGTYATHAVYARMPSLAGSFSFKQRTLLRKLIELVKPPQRVGDPVFDDHVTALGAPAAALARALSSDGFQSAVLEMAIAASFTVAGGALEWVCVRTAPDEQLLRETRRNAAVVLHHLEKATGS